MKAHIVITSTAQIIKCRVLAFISSATLCHFTGKQSTITVCMPDHFSLFCCRLLTYFKMDFFIRIFQKHYKSVKRFNPDLDSNCFPKLISTWSFSKPRSPRLKANALGSPDMFTIQTLTQAQKFKYHTNMRMSYEGCSNMNASSFITFFTYMLRQNVIPFWIELFVAFKMAPNIKKH